VWRGETPQARKGRFREFYQCDIDIINRDRLSYLAEAEIPSVIYSVFREMAIGEFRIRINNRKVLRGLLQEFGVAQESSPQVLRILDKAEKEDGARLVEELEREGLARGAAGDLFNLVVKKRSTQETLAVLAPLKGCAQGLEELTQIAEAIGKFGVPDAAFAIDLGVVRGLDYYTGAIYETTLVQYPELGSICSGGRYDDLASYFTDTRLPGVGISIGLTRLFSKLKEAGLLQPLETTPAQVLVTTMDARYLDRYLGVAQALRAAGVNTEVYLEQARLGNQLTYADRKGFRLAIIAGENEFGRDVVQIKNLTTKTPRDVPVSDIVSAVTQELR
jgi:histidyl-tRNA synthetase